MAEKNYMDIINSWNRVYIVGAHGRGRTLRKYLSLTNPQIEIAAFLVSDADNNPEEIENIPVRFLEDRFEGNLNMPVLVATKMQYHSAIKEKLVQLGFENIIFLTPEWDNAIKRMYFKKRFTQSGKSFLMLSNDSHKNISKRQLNECIQVYAVKSVFDKEVDVSMYDKWWIRDIQAGAALTDQSIADVKDNTGKNISHKNSSYCELTAIYWLWKNIRTDYVGVCHYRRRFELNENMLSAMIEEDIDVVLPVPTGCEPSVRENYYERHRKEDWDVMMQVLKEHFPEYYIASKEIFEDNYYYACNMWIMRREILGQFAQWLFDILDKIEQVCEEREATDSYQRRYVGFLAERLTTLYFIFHEKEWKLAYADKVFIG